MKLTGLSSQTLSDWINLIREEASTYLLNSPSESYMIGGVGRVVEIDKTLISKKRKNNRGAVREELWMFGGVERGTGKIFAVMVPLGRSREELLPILKKFIKPDTIIYSDQWGAYYQSSSFDLSTVPEKNWQHFTVNHSLHFVNLVTLVHTNTVEGKWENLKMDLKKLRGLPKELKPAFTVRGNKDSYFSLQFLPLF